MELVAPSKCLLQPLQAPVYVFVIDVSAPAVASGAVAQVSASIKACLDALPGQPRTQVLTVPDLAELYLPLPDDLLVNLAEARGVVDALLDALPLLFAHTRRPEAALGPALVGPTASCPTSGAKCASF